MICFATKIILITEKINSDSEKTFILYEVHESVTNTFFYVFKQMSFTFESMSRGFFLITVC